MIVYTVIGAKVDTKKLLAADEKERRGWSLEDAVERAALHLIHDEKGNSYLCTRSHQFQIDGDRLYNYGPLVIYQDSDWNKHKVLQFLEALKLWLPGSFGVWTFVAR